MPSPLQLGARVSAAKGHLLPLTDEQKVTQQTTDKRIRRHRARMIGTIICSIEIKDGLIFVMILVKQVIVVATDSFMKD